MVSSEMLSPVIALALWTFVIEFWLYKLRLPAIFAMKVKLTNSTTKEEFNSRVPLAARFKADNYNHLHEQPTVFYAVCIVVHLLDKFTGIDSSLAWAYVILRIVHSLIQCTINHIPSRFLVFIISSIVLFSITLRAALTFFLIDILYNC